MESIVHLSKKVFNLYKPPGWTPLQAVEQFRKNTPELSQSSLTYAGRLDPLAEGVLIVLADEAIKQKESYLGLSKTYKAEILCGIETDSYDTLGIIQNTAPGINPTPSQITAAIKQLLLLDTITVPPFSSIPVNGRPLFEWARENKLSEITLPTRPLLVESFSHLSTKQIPSTELRTRIIDQVDSVQGEFRQEKIKECWEKFFSQHSHALTSITVEIQCGSGTYIRSIAHELGRILGCSALLLHLKRTRVGTFGMEESYQFPSHKSTPI